MLLYGTKILSRKKMDKILNVEFKKADEIIENMNLKPIKCFGVNDHEICMAKLKPSIVPPRPFKKEKRRFFLDPTENDRHIKECNAIIPRKINQDILNWDLFDFYNDLIKNKTYKLLRKGEKHLLYNFFRNRNYRGKSDSPIIFKDYFLEFFPFNFIKGLTYVTVNDYSGYIGSFPRGLRNSHTISHDKYEIIGWTVKLNKYFTFDNSNFVIPYRGRINNEVKLDDEFTVEDFRFIYFRFAITNEKIKNIFNLISQYKLKNVAVYMITGSDYKLRKTSDIDDTHRFQEYESDIKELDDPKLIWFFRGDSFYSIDELDVFIKNKGNSLE